MSTELLEKLHELEIGLERERSQLQARVETAFHGREVEHQAELAEVTQRLIEAEASRTVKVIEGPETRSVKVELVIDGVPQPAVWTEARISEESEIVTERVWDSIYGQLKPETLTVEPVFDDARHLRLRAEATTGNWSTTIRQLQLAAQAAVELGKREAAFQEGDGEAIGQALSAILWALKAGGANLNLNGSNG
jgi:hypothetical protein